MLQAETENTAGYHRVVPYEDDGLVITVLPIILTNQWVKTKERTHGEDSQERAQRQLRTSKTLKN
jgi:hypothetical protein